MLALPAAIAAASEVVMEHTLLLLLLACGATTADGAVTVLPARLPVLLPPAVGLSLARQRAIVAPIALGMLLFRLEPE